MTSTPLSPREIADLKPVMLRGLTWKRSKAALEAVDCAIRRAHWCSPVVILGGDGKYYLDDDGELSRFTFMRGDRSSADWSMVPRRDDEGDEIEPTYRRSVLQEEASRG